MKLCPKCQKTLDLSCFGKDTPRKDGLQVYCKECRKPIRKQWYNDKGSQHRKMVNDRNNQARDTLTDFVVEYLFRHPCVDCGENDPIVLEFDHVKGVKSYNICHMISKLAPIEAVKIEIEKCEVRCANCHRRKTAKQFNFRKHILVAQKKEQLRPKEKAVGANPIENTTFLET